MPLSGLPVSGSLTGDTAHDIQRYIFYNHRFLLLYQCFFQHLLHLFYKHNGPDHLLISPINLFHIRLSSDPALKSFVIPAYFAASIFSFSPPIGSTRPRRVISPVMARSARTARPVMAESIAVAIVIPADGPSFGTAPSGM